MLGPFYDTILGFSRVFYFFLVMFDRQRAGPKFQHAKEAFQTLDDLETIKHLRITEHSLQRTRRSRWSGPLSMDLWPSTMEGLSGRLGLHPVHAALQDKVC